MRRMTIIFIILFIYTGTADAQSIRFGAGGGLTFLLSPGSFTDDIDTLGTQYGFKSNYNFGLKVEGSITGAPLNFYGKIFYTSLNGSKDNVIVNEGGVNVASDFETAGSIFTVAVGGEYILAPSPISPYINLELQLNSLGDLDFTRTTGGRTLERSTELGTRFGFGLGAGIDISVSQFTIDTNLSFNFPNLIGQDTGESTITNLNFTIIVMYTPL